MKFEFNIQINNQSNDTYEGILKFEPRDFSLVDLSTAMDKTIYENIEIPSGQTSKWYKTEVETTQPFDPSTFRPDIHFRTSIELELEKPTAMFASVLMEANASGKCYAFVDIDPSGEISVKHNDKPVINPDKMKYTAWTRNR